jgi:RNA polymerase sigma factor (sigma-70 family)
MNAARSPVPESALSRTGGWLHTDVGLLVRLRDADDLQAWQRLSNCYGPLIQRAAMRNGLGECEAQEVAQDTLVSVWRRMVTFHYEPERCSFKGWLMHLAHGHIRDHLRKRRTQARWFEPMETAASGPTAEVLDDTAGAAFSAILNEEWERQVLTLAEQRVRDAVNAKHFEVWRLRCREGLSVEAVSERLGAMPCWVRLVSHRVGRRMQREVGRLEAERF